jgi:DNA-binding transcriptional LysR family regulator
VLHGPRLRGLELPGLAALAALAATRTLSDAADDLGVPPALVLRRIERLERATGHSLVERDGAGARMTAAGRLLAEHARAITGALDVARAEVGALREGRRGTVRLGVAAGVPDQIVAALVAELACLRGGLLCASTALGDRRAALTALRTGAHHAVLVTGAPPTAPLAGAPLLEDPWMLVVAADSPLAERGAPPQHDDLDALDYVEGPDATAQALVAAGLGAAILPRSGVDEGHPGTVAIGLGHLLPPRTMALAWRAAEDRAPAVAAAREAAAAACAQIAAHRALLALMTV